MTYISYLKTNVIFLSRILQLPMVLQHASQKLKQKNKTFHTVLHVSIYCKQITKSIQKVHVQFCT